MTELAAKSFHAPFAALLDAEPAVGGPLAVSLVKIMPGEGPTQPALRYLLLRRCKNGGVQHRVLGASILGKDVVLKVLAAVKQLGG